MSATLSSPMSAPTSGRRRRSRGGGFRALAVGIVLLAAANAGLYATAPELFTVDLAKGPYTEAKNLELTRVFNRALPLYEKIVIDYPGSEYAVLSRIGIANAYIGLGRPADALDQYEALLRELRDDPLFPRYRYTILERMASVYRDGSDSDGFAAVFAELEKDYPDSDATREGRVYLERVKASAATSTAAAMPEGFPLVIEGAAITLPESVKVGDKFELSIPVAPANGQTTDFSLVTELGFWQGFRVEQLTPTPQSVADFWGRRTWQFPALKAPMTVIARIVATKAGVYTLDLDAEINLDVVELGISRAVTVED